jgi:hypothetical protein
MSPSFSHERMTEAEIPTISATSPIFSNGATFGVMALWGAIFLPPLPFF